MCLQNTQYNDISYRYEIYNIRNRIFPNFSLKDCRDWESLTKGGNTFNTTLLDPAKNIAFVVPISMQHPKTTSTLN